jgi:hypothetical protein
VVPVLLPLLPVLPLVLGLVGAGAGLDVLPEVLGLDELGLDMLPLELPLAPAPAPVRASARHLSRSVPESRLHFAFASVLPLAPAAAPVELPLAPVELEPLVEGAVVLPEAAPPTLEPDEPVEPDAPVLPELDPDDCENAAEDRASSAAAVAAVRVFNIMTRISSRLIE